MYCIVHCKGTSVVISSSSPFWKEAFPKFNLKSADKSASHITGKPQFKFINLQLEKQEYLIYPWYEAEFKVFEPRLNYGWLYLKLYQIFQDLSRVLADLSRDLNSLNSVSGL